MNVKILSLMIAFSGIALLQNTASEAQFKQEVNSPTMVATISPADLGRALNGVTIFDAGTRWKAEETVDVGGKKLSVLQQTRSGKDMIIKYQIGKEPPETIILTRQS